MCACPGGMHGALVPRSGCTLLAISRPGIVRYNVEHAYSVPVYWTRCVEVGGRRKGHQSPRRKSPWSEFICRISRVCACDGHGRLNDLQQAMSESGAAHPSDGICSAHLRDARTAGAKDVATARLGSRQRSRGGQGGRIQRATCLSTWGGTRGTATP